MTKKLCSVLSLVIIISMLLTGCGNYSAKDIGDKLDNLEKIGYYTKTYYSSTYYASKNGEYVFIYVKEDTSSAKEFYEYIKNKYPGDVVERDKNIIYLGTTRRVVNDARQC